LRLAQPLGVAEHALARSLRIQLGHLRLERLEPLHVLGERRDRFVHRPGRVALKQRFEPMRAIPLALPPQDRLAHPPAPRLDRLPDRDGHVGEEFAELVAPPPPPPPPPPTLPPGPAPPPPPGGPPPPP